MFTSKKKSKKNDMKNEIEFNDIINKILEGKMDISENNHDDELDEFDAAMSSIINDIEKTSDNNCDEEPTNNSNNKNYSSECVEFDTQRVIRICVEDSPFKTKIFKISDGIKTASIDITSAMSSTVEMPNIIIDKNEFKTPYDIAKVIIESILPCFYPMGIFSTSTAENRFSYIKKYNNDKYFFYQSNGFIFTYIVSENSLNELMNVIEYSIKTDSLNEFIVSLLNIVESFGFSNRYMFDNQNESVKFSMMVGTSYQNHQNAAFENIIKTDDKTESLDDNNIYESLSIMTPFYRNDNIYSLVIPDVIPYCVHSGITEEVENIIAEISTTLINDDTMRNIVDSRILSNFANCDYDEYEDEEPTSECDELNSTPDVMEDDSTNNADIIIEEKETVIINESDELIIDNHNDINVSTLLNAVSNMDTEEILSEVKFNNDVEDTNNNITINGKPINEYDSKNEDDTDDIFSDIEDDYEDYPDDNVGKLSPMKNEKKKNDNDDPFILKRRN